MDTPAKGVNFEQRTIWVRRLARRPAAGRWLPGLPCVAFLLLSLASEGRAQSVQADVQLMRPNASVANRLDLLRDAPRPQIGLFYSEQTAFYNPDYAATVRESVRQWEMLLVGLELPYRVIEDSSLARLPSDSLRLLIMPAAEALSERQREAIRRHLAQGGGLIAAGRVGFLDQRGVVQNDRFFRELFEAEPSIDFPDSLEGFSHTIEGGHLPTAGIPPGYRLNISRPSFGMAVIPIRSRAMGRIALYRSTSMRVVDEALAASTLLLRGVYRGGRFVWLGFNPQDVSRNDQQQAVYQSLILQAMAYTAGVPVVGLRAWPHGYQSAASLVMLPSSGYQPYSYRIGTDLILRSLEQTGAPATYFLVADQAADHPDLIERMARYGELAVSSDTEDLLIDQPEEQQAARIQHARLVLSGRSKAPVSGLHPPGGYYDASTLQAMQSAGLRYLLSSEKALECPDFIPWEDLLDYRDPLLAGILNGGPEEAATDEAPDPNKTLLIHPSFFSYNFTSPRGAPGDEHDLIQDWLRQLRDDFERAHRSGGHHVFAFEPEFMGLSRQRAGILGDYTGYLRSHSAWLTTLGAVSEWWLKRARISVELTGGEPHRLALVVRNAGTMEVEGVSLDVTLPPFRKVVDLSAPGLDVSRIETENGLVILIEKLPPGERVIHLGYLPTDFLPPGSEQE